MKINVFGVRYCDIVLYLSRILKEMGENVLISDRTESKIMSLYFPDIPGFDMSGNIIGYRGIDYCMKGSLPDSINEAAYTFVFEIFEMKELPIVFSRNEEESEYTLIVGDEAPEHAGAIEEYFSCLEGNCSARTMLVVRDYTGFAREQYDSVRTALTERYCFDVPYSRGDRKAELNAVYRGSSRFTSVSETLCLTLEEIIRIIKPEITPREWRRAYRHAERGGSR